ncbi:hypothetical protein [Paludisphaera mucosa]|uniref:Uncharacterized protein n=1 Tax=Paludisphaera mucosa TaxID=3030827 RepID=A0ABT6FD25_9BACT|nr:hypothetical protein [Paludisphaera mucosa]MDG3005498.1 hypothetical protein [Paludisphaera mucosa]
MREVIMGLEAFLIPSESTSAGPGAQYDRLTDLLVSPPVIPEDDAKGTTPPFPTFVSTTPAAAVAIPEATVVLSSPSVEAISLAELPLVASPSVDEFIPPPEATAANPPQPLAFMPLSSTPHLDIVPGGASQLDGFLAATSFDEAVTAPTGNSFDDETVIAPASLYEAPESIDAPTSQGELRSDSAASINEPSRHRLSTSRPRNGPQAFSSLGARDDMTGGHVAWDETLERIEGRLIQIAAKVDHALERLASPGPVSLGSKSRSFRGRIDG